MNWESHFSPTIISQIDSGIPSHRHVFATARKVQCRRLATGGEISVRSVGNFDIVWPVANLDHSDKNQI